MLAAIRFGAKVTAAVVELYYNRRREGGKIHAILQSDYAGGMVLSGKSG